MDKEYIDREEFCKKYCLCNVNMCEKEKCQIFAIHAADVTPIVHGHWIIGTDDDNYDVLCQNCGYSEIFGVCGILSVKDIAAEMHYCPNCGAKMDVVF